MKFPLDTNALIYLQGEGGMQGGMSSVSSGSEFGVSVVIVKIEGLSAMSQRIG